MKGWTPEHLGKRSAEPTKKLDLIPWEGGDLVVSLSITEFTSRCPVTGMPDFGQFVVEYAPRDHIAETKSVKLYFMGYRDEARFNEQLVNDIADDWMEQLNPLWLRVIGSFNLRGGIGVTATAERGRLPGTLSVD